MTRVAVVVIVVASTLNRIGSIVFLRQGACTCDLLSFLAVPATGEEKVTPTGEPKMVLMKLSAGSIEKFFRGDLNRCFRPSTFALGDLQPGLKYLLKSYGEGDWKGIIRRFFAGGCGSGESFSWIARLPSLFTGT